MKEEYIYLELPLPPSINKCYAGMQKRHKSNNYKAWIQKAEIELSKQAKYKISGNEWLHITLDFLLPLYYKNGNKKKQDLDNFIKPLLDFLGDNIKGFKDEFIKIIIAKKIDSNENKVKLKIYETTLNI